MALFRKLTAMGATIILLHHIGKSENARDYRGSSDYKVSIDIGYKLTNLGDPSRLSILELKPFKQRFSVSPILHLRYNDGLFSVDQAGTPKTESERLSDLLKENPGVTKGAFEALASGRNLGRNRARSFLDNGTKGGTIRIEIGENNKRQHFWTAEPVSFACAGDLE